MTQCLMTIAPDGSALVSVVGEVDLSNADELTTVGERALAQSDAVEIDLSGLVFIDSSGLGSLIQLGQEAARRGKTLTLSNVRPPIRRLLEITKLDHFFDIQVSQMPSAAADS